MEKMINYKSDFKLIESGCDFTVPFRFVYSTGQGQGYEASHIDGVYHNCKLLDDGRLMVVFDSHGMQPGKLFCTRHFYLTDKDYHDGICDLWDRRPVGVALCNGKTDGTDVEVELPPYYQQGDGGSQYGDVEKLTLTEEQSNGNDPIDFDISAATPYRREIHDTYGNKLGYVEFCKGKLYLEGPFTVQYYSERQEKWLKARHSHSIPDRIRAFYRENETGRIYRRGVTSRYFPNIYIEETDKAEDRHIDLQLQFNRENTLILRTSRPITEATSLELYRHISASGHKENPYGEVTDNRTKGWKYPSFSNMMDKEKKEKREALLAKLRDEFSYNLNFIDYTSSGYVYKMLFDVRDIPLAFLYKAVSGTIDYLCFSNGKNQKRLDVTRNNTDTVTLHYGLALHCGGNRISNIADLKLRIYNTARLPLTDGGGENHLSLQSSEEHIRKNIFVVR